MKYLCLVVLDERKYEALSGSELQALDDAAIDFADAMHHSGRMLSGSALESTQSATTVRVHNGTASVTDGPFAETNEQVGGFMLLEARDLNEAIALVAKFPVTALGGVEIRPLRELVSSANPEKRSWQS